MATIAFEPTPAAFPGRASQRLVLPRTAGPAIPAPATIALPPAASVPPMLEVIEHVLPLSGCRLTVLDMPDGARVGRLSTAAGRWLAETRCELESQVSGWFGRSGRSGTAWALAFGAGGSHESLEVRFASLRARRVVPVVSDHYGLWVAEVAGAFRAATIISPRATNTFRLHLAA